MSRYRLFLTTSPLNTFLVTGYARQTKRAGDRDVLVLDYLKQKPSIVRQIKTLSSLHLFDEVHDFTLPLEDSGTTRPGLVKKMTRFLKKRPGFKQVYDFLYYFRLKKDHRKFRRMLTAAGIDAGQSPVELYLQPLLRFNEPLKQMFPSAELHYFEHGIGDYVDILEEQPGGWFHCVFSDGYKAYLHEKGITRFTVEPAGNPMAGKDAGRLTELFPQLNQLKELNDELVLLITQPVEDFAIPNTFWPYFLDLVLAKLDAPEKFTFLIKIHQRQNASGIQTIIDHLTGRGLRIHLIDDPEVNNVCLEVMYGVIKDRVSYVVSPYSSAVFYLSEMYDQGPCRFYYSFESLKQFDQLTPVQYRRRWEEIQRLTGQLCGGVAEEIF